MCNCATIAGQQDGSRQRCSNCNCPDRARPGSLGICAEGDIVVVKSNPDGESTGMGFTPGCLVRVIQNNFRKEEMLIDICGREQFLARIMAENIMVTSL